MKRLTLVHQNDIHAHVEPHLELRWSDGRPDVWSTGGAARIRSLVDDIRRECGGAVLHVDSGDAIHGTGPAQWSQGASITPVLNAMGVDVMTPGNWEFGFGPAILSERASELSFGLLACNVRRAGDGASPFAAYEVRDVGHARVACIGLTSPIVGRTMPQAFGAGLRFLEPADVLPELVASVRDRERPDLVVLISHYGFAQEVELARRIEGIDVILGGHTHDALARPVTIGSTIITQSGAHGSYLTRLDLEIHSRRVIVGTHALIPVDLGAPEPAVTEVVTAAMRPFRERLDEVVGHASGILHRGTALESPMDALIADAYRSMTGARIAVSHGWRYGTPIAAGRITMGDLWQMIPTNPEVFTVTITGSRLQRMLEQSLERMLSADPARQQGGYVMRFSGMTVAARLNNPAGVRVVAIDVDGAPLDPRERYTVAAAGDQTIADGIDRIPSGLCAIDAITGYLARVDTVEPHGPPRLIAV